jgi:hypothetical protein
MDITHIPMARGFRLSCVVDWFSRKVLAWKLSITLETEFCLEAVEEALARYGKPGIFKHRSGLPIHGKGASTSSSSACGRPSNTRRCTYGPTPVSRRRGPPSAAISTAVTSMAFTMPGGPIRPLTGGRRMRPTPLRRSQSRLPHNHGRNPLSRCQPAVQTNRASSAAPGAALWHRRPKGGHFINWSPPLGRSGTRGNLND